MPGINLAAIQGSTNAALTGLAFKQSAQSGITAGLKAGGPALGLVAGFGLAGAAGMGLLSFFGARSANKAIERSANRQFRQLDEQITRTQMQGHLQQNDLAVIGRQAEGSASVRLSAVGTGRSINRILGEFAEDVTASSLALQQRTEDLVEQAEYQKEAIAAAASNQTQNPLFAGIMGAISGGQAGMNLGASLNALQSAGRLQQTQAATGIARNSLGALDFALAASRNAGLMESLNRQHSEYQALLASHRQLQGQSDLFKDIVDRTSGMDDPGVQGLLKMLMQSR